FAARQVDRSARQDHALIVPAHNAAITWRRETRAAAAGVMAGQPKRARWREGGDIPMSVTSW
ncbi:MAG: hypothetical protein VX394_12020, partial [Pseudomonadota bacterium]|nr:hypothetical protein [Pseudomonadota bacterium]